MDNIKLSTSYFILSNESNLPNQYYFLLLYIYNKKYFCTIDKAIEKMIFYLIIN